MATQIVLIDDSAIYSLGIKASILNYAGISADIRIFTISELYQSKGCPPIEANCVGIHFDAREKYSEITRLIISLKKRNRKLKIIAYYDSLSPGMLENISRCKPAGFFQLSAQPCDIGAVFKKVAHAGTKIQS
jgi:hypothetical protein